MAEHVLRASGRLTTGWTQDSIADFAWSEIDKMDEPPWRRWHSAAYSYDHVREDENNLNLLLITPLHDEAKRVFVADDYRSFIGTMRNGVGDKLAEPESKSGTAYFVRRGAPRAGRFFGFTLYVGRVTHWRMP